MWIGIWIGKEEKGVKKTRQGKKEKEEYEKEEIKAKGVTERIQGHKKIRRKYQNEKAKANAKANLIQDHTLSSGVWTFLGVEPLPKDL